MGILSYPQKGANFIKEKAQRGWNNYLYLVEVQEQNLGLQKQIALLELENQLLREKAMETERLQSLLGFKNSINFETVTAKIVAWDLSSYAQTFIINLGEEDGIKERQPVISPQGLVGQIIDEPGRPISKHSAYVLLILDRGSRVSVMVQRTRDRAILEGIGKKEHLLIKYLSPEVKLESGDMVITSGLGGIFPAGIEVGKLLSIEGNPFLSSAQGWVQPSVDFFHLEEVLVIIGDKKQ